MQLGPLVVVCFALLAMLMGWVPSPLTRVSAIEDIVRDLAARVDTNAAKIEGALDGAQTKQGKEREEQTRLLRAICRNVAKSDITRDACER